MIEPSVDRLGRGGVTEVVLALGFKPEPFMDAFPDGRCGDVRAALRRRARAARHRRGDPLRRRRGRHRRHVRRGQRRRAHRPRRRRTSSPSTAERGRGDDPPDRRRRPVELRRRRRRRRRRAGLVRRSSRSRRPAPSRATINAGTYVLEPSVLDLMPAGRAVLDRARHVPAASSPGRPLRRGHRRLLDRRRSARAVPRSANLDLLGDARRFDRCVPIDDTAPSSPPRPSSATASSAPVPGWPPTPGVIGLGDPPGAAVERRAASNGRS